MSDRRKRIEGTPFPTVGWVVMDAGIDGSSWMMGMSGFLVV